MKSIFAAEFEARCFQVIEQMREDCEPVTITENGRPLAVLSPYSPSDRTGSIIGAMRGSVLRYDDPFESVTDPADRAAVRPDRTGLTRRTRA